MLQELINHSKRRFQNMIGKKGAVMSKIKRDFKTVIITFSPHGNTRKIAERIHAVFDTEKLNVSLLDLTGNDMDTFQRFDALAIPPFDLLIIVSPVYAWKIVLPLEILLSNMPAKPGKYAAVAVTYGGVTSGHALYNAVSLLAEKGFNALGALKVVASHSNVLDERKDPFSSHPNDADLEKADQFTHGIIEKMKKCTQ
jgi:flavodoxin